MLFLPSVGISTWKTSGGGVLSLFLWFKWKKPIKCARDLKVEGFASISVDTTINFNLSRYVRIKLDVFNNCSRNDFQ